MADKPGPEEKYLEKLEGNCQRVGPPDPTFDLAGRNLWTVVDGERVVAPLEEALVVGSRLAGTDPVEHPDLDTQARFKPVLDIDVPMRLVPSSTPGHSHLLIDKEMDWERFKSLITALYQVGLVEEGYVAASLTRGDSFVRLPWIAKGEPHELRTPDDEHETYWCSGCPWSPGDIFPTRRGWFLAHSQYIPYCKTCGCTEDRACLTGSGPCGWAIYGELCTACEEKEAS